MIGKKTLETKPIPAAKVKEIMEEFSEKHELSYEQNLTLDHASNLTKLSLEDTEKLIEELEAYVEYKQAVRIADIVPKDMADLRLIFAKERNSPSNHHLKGKFFLLQKLILNHPDLVAGDRLCELHA
jgi:DNA-directed RNA polymerase subunit F